MTQALAVPSPFERIKSLVLDSVSSPSTRLAYGTAIDDFERWWNTAGKPTFNRACVQMHRAYLEQRGLSAASINQKLSAMRKLAREAAYAGLLDQETAMGIRDVHGAKSQGVRTGNWITHQEAQDLINKPDAETLKGKRDRAMLAVMIGCGLRRDEVARLQFDNIRQLEGRWVIADLRGKHGRVRSIPMPGWAKVAINIWADAAGISTGSVFRGMTSGGKIVTRETVTAQTVWRCVDEYSNLSPHDLRRTYAKLAHKGGAKLDQIQLSLGHNSLMTTERYLGVQQDLTDAPCDYIRMKLTA